MLASQDSLVPEIDSEVKSVFEMLVLEFANRIPAINLVLVSEFEDVTTWNGKDGLGYASLGKFRTEDAETIVDTVMKKEYAMRLHCMKQVQDVNVFIETTVRPSGSVLYTTRFSWQYRKTCCAINKYHPCMYHEWMHSSDASYYQRRGYYFWLILAIFAILAYSLSLVFAIKDSINHPEVTVEATCDALTQKAYQYCNSTSTP